MADLSPLISIVVAAIAALPGLLALVAQRKKVSTDAAGVLTKSVLSTLERKDKDIADTEQELGEARAEAQALNKRLDDTMQEKLRLQSHVKVIGDKAAELSRDLADCREERAKLRAQLDEQGKAP